MGTRTARGEYGNGSVYHRASDNRWVGTLEAGWTARGTRRRIVVTAKTEPEVKRKLRDRRRSLDQGPVEQTRITVKAWSATWLEITERTDAPKSHSTDRSAVRLWIIPTIGHKQLSQLTPADVRAVATAQRAAGRKSSTALRTHSTLSRMLKAAIQEGHIVAPRVLSVKPPAVSANDREPLSTPEALAVLQVAASLPHGSRWVAGLLQAMRQAECLGATWEQVDLEAGSLIISWQLQALPYLDKHDRSRGFRVPDGYEARQVERTLHLVRPKSKSGWRVIPLVPWMVSALTQWRQVCPPTPHGLVWPTADGRPGNAKKDTAEWEELQRLAAVAHPSGRPYKGHEARHTTATLLMQLGVPETVIMAIMGHSSMVSTRSYLHADRADALKALDQVAERLQLR